MHVMSVLEGTNALLHFFKKNISECMHVRGRVSAPARRAREQIRNFARMY